MLLDASGINKHEKICPFFALHRNAKQTFCSFILGVCSHVFLLE
jgi:hypothetical protein